MDVIVRALFEVAIEWAECRVRHCCRCRRDKRRQMARAVVQAGPAGTDAQRVGNGLALLVHIGGIPISSGQLRVCLIIPIGKPQRRVASSLLQHTLEIPQEHPMPREELYCTVLTPAPRCSFVGIGCDPGLNATHSRPNNRTCAVTPE